MYVLSDVDLAYDVVPLGLCLYCQASAIISGVFLNACVCVCAIVCNRRARLFSFHVGLGESLIQALQELFIPNSFDVPSACVYVWRMFRAHPHESYMNMSVFSMKSNNQELL